MWWIVITLLGLGIIACTFYAVINLGALVGLLMEGCSDFERSPWIDTET